jgi:intergrase/recombinase
MTEWLLEALHFLPHHYTNLLLFCTLTGMRASECIASVRLIKNSESLVEGQYYDPERQILQHYKFPQIFIRRTKAIYISVVDREILRIAQEIDQILPSYYGLKKAIMRRSLSMRIKYCRKIYASWLRQSGIEPEIIDMLRGRVGKNIFLRHYYRPSSDYYKRRVLASLKQLQGRLIPEKRASDGGIVE